MDLEERLATESKRIVRNARGIYRRKKLNRGMYLSRNGLFNDIDIISSPLQEIDKYIDSNKKKGKFYLVGINGINPRRFVITPFLDFIYSALFYRGIASLGDVKIKKSIYRKLGMTIGKNVHIYQGAKFDIIFSKLIEIGDNSTIGGESTLYNHSIVISRDYFGWGIVHIGKNCTIGDRSFIAGIRMGDNSILKPNTIAAGYLFNVKTGQIFGGNPPRKLTA